MRDAGATSQLDLPVTPPESFERVYAEQVDFAWRVLRRLGVGDADVADACQDVFVVVHRKLANFAGRSSLRGWVFGICLKVASEYRRRAHRRHEVRHDDVNVFSCAADQQERVEHREACAALDAILHKLDEDKRVVFILYELEDMPMAEIAELSGCPLQTAYSRLHAARTQVKAAYAEQARGEGRP
jgi:RNA polymerase sigma-70 factor (ECF subfamily)